MFGSVIKGLIGGLENGVKANADRARGDHVKCLVTGLARTNSHAALAWIVEESIEESKSEEKGTEGYLYCYDYVTVSLLLSRAYHFHNVPFSRSSPGEDQNCN